MSEDINETQPTPTGSSVGETMPVGVTYPTTARAGDTTLEPGKIPVRKRRFGWVPIFLLGWLFLFIVAGIGGYQGYLRGLEDRIDTQATEAVEDLNNQYELALKNFTAGEYELARQRLEYILNKDPNYAKAGVLLAQTLAVLLATATPTPVTPTPTPTLTPTPDLRDVEEIFNTARTAMQEENWDMAISSLLSLRQKDPAYRAVDVDSMLYVSFRYRGVEKILTRGELESGLLDLSQAELFGPLDTEAQSYANFASLFVIGVSFWEVDWGQAAYYFGQVAPYLPNMHNGDFWLASQRYVEAMQYYIDQLVASNDYCAAQEQMEILRQYNTDPALEPTQTWIDNKCRGEDDEGDNEEDEQPESTPVPSETTPVPTEETPAPTEEPAPTEAPAPTETPTP